MASVRTCSQCIAQTKKRKQCTLHTCTTGPRCWIHTKSEEGLRVKPSQIPGAGKGLYTTVKRPAKSVVGYYTGKWLTVPEFNARYPGDVLVPYAVTVTKKRGKRVVPIGVIDASATNSGNMRYINTCDAPVGKKRLCRNNVQFKSTNRKMAVKVCPGQNLQPNDEMYVSYGPEYDINGQRLNAIDCG